VVSDQDDRKAQSREDMKTSASISAFINIATGGLEFRCQPLSTLKVRKKLPGCWTRSSAASVPRGGRSWHGIQSQSAGVCLGVRCVLYVLCMCEVCVVCVGPTVLDTAVIAHSPTPALFPLMYVVDGHHSLSSYPRLHYFCCIGTHTTTTTTTTAGLH
jgi:hypothetical protein